MNRSLFQTLLALLIILTACASPTPTAPAPPTEIPTLTASTPTETATLSPTATETLPPTATSTETPAPTDTPTATPLPTETPTLPIPEGERFVDPINNLYSLIPPEGWLSDLAPIFIGSEANVPRLYNPQNAERAINMTFILSENPDNLTPAAIIALWKETQSQNPAFTGEISETLLTSFEGSAYTRWEVTFTTSRTVFYFFASGGWNLAIIYDRPLDQGIENDPLVDLSVQTVHFAP